MSGSIRWQHDIDLHRRSVQGDEAAARSLVDQLSPQAYALAWRMLGNAADAQDVVQDALVRILTASQYAGQSSLRTYAYSIVSRLCLDRLRAGKPEMLTDADLDDCIDESAVNPETRHIQQDAARQLQQALAALSPRQRLAVAMWLHDDAEVFDIAQVMGLSQNAAHQLLFRGKEKLRRLLEPHVKGGLA